MLVVWISDVKNDPAVNPPDKTVFPPTLRFFWIATPPVTTTAPLLVVVLWVELTKDDMPANLGLWDQNLALKWVQENIKDFGGNPDQASLEEIYI